MKRIFAILFLIAILLSACTSDYKIAVGESMKNINQLYKAYININGLSAYQINEKYLVTIY